MSAMSHTTAKQERLAEYREENKRLKQLTADMLEALRAIKAMYSSFEEIADLCGAAIAKAEGNQP